MGNEWVAAIIGLLAAIVGGIIGAISAQSMVQRRIQMENVTQERAKWRDRIRCLASKVHDTIMMEGNLDYRKKELYRLQNRFRALLNPGDHEDEEIINRIACISKPKEDHAEEFGKLISHLLKHDWERAKEEVKHPLFQWRKPRRQKFRCQNMNPTRQKSICQKIIDFCQKIIEYRRFWIIFVPFLIIIYIRIMIFFIELIFCKYWPLDIISGLC